MTHHENERINDIIKRAIKLQIVTKKDSETIEKLASHLTGILNNTAKVILKMTDENFKAFINQALKELK